MYINIVLEKPKVENGSLIGEKQQTMEPYYFMLLEKCPNANTHKQ